ncbi:hypothetical protein LY622_21245 [Halomonas sp. M5N1S17]|uniref:hypothetical protein n=1 Tax=Halomonas alkalisoli TaxID=2907158 RepID=UPI001F4455D2|nr:hypothetical protein [Halomonas alkalisoli]MCE9665960.1 hypothetical protein [Halomonas alkalisoli]MCE9680870.1 hypothetical protein [Halomonas alkalisoli]
MKNTVAIAGALLTAALGVNAHAVDDCEVEDWVPVGEPGFGGGMIISGVTTCESARIRLRIYSEDGEYLGNARAFVRGHSFDAAALIDYREDLKIEFNLSPAPWDK